MTKKRKEPTKAKMLSLEKSLWDWVAGKARSEGISTPQQFIASTLRKMKAKEATAN